MMDISKERQEWLKKRSKGIGGSDAAAIVGLNQWKTNVRLWEEKTGRVKPEDISGKDVVQYGIKSENHLRELFKLDFPQYEVGYQEYFLHKHPEYDFLYATLDGELIEKETGSKGVLEIKTCQIMNSVMMLKWKGRIPDSYYIQILHQLLVTGWDFAVMKANLKTEWFEETAIQVKHYTIKREEVLADMEFLLEKELEFWNHNVLRNIKPNLILPSV